MHSSVTNVLFVSRDNACRSLLGEACLRHLGGKKFKAYSCGVPTDIAERPHSWTLLALQTAGMSTADLRCKGWTEFTRNGAPKMDFVISLDAQTAEEQPSWLGQPETALWEYPAVVVRKKNTEKDAGIAALHTLHSLRRRIELLVSLHSRVRNRADLRHDLRDLAHL
jgi:protein-tyrosine-phosphatase